MKQLLAEIFRRHHKDIYQYLYSLCRDASLAEDLTSEVFLQAGMVISGSSPEMLLPSSVVRVKESPSARCSPRRRETDRPSASTARTAVTWLRMGP